MTTYDVPEEEMAKIRFVNGTHDDRKVKCKCAIHDNKPSFCRQGPLPESLMPGCGYYFVEEEGKLVRKGKCLFCGRCCALPRHKNSEFGFYDPNGGKCKHLIVEEQNEHLPSN